MCLKRSCCSSSTKLCSFLSFITCPRFLLKTVTNATTFNDLMFQSKVFYLSCELCFVISRSSPRSRSQSDLHDMTMVRSDGEDMEEEARPYSPTHFNISQPASSETDTCRLASTQVLPVLLIFEGGDFCTGYHQRLHDGFNVQWKWIWSLGCCHTLQEISAKCNWVWQLHESLGFICFFIASCLKG